MIIGKWSPSPHGLRLIICIHEGFLLFLVGDALLEYVSDYFTLTTIVGDPIRETIATFVPKHPLGVDLRQSR